MSRLQEFHNLLECKTEFLFHILRIENMHGALAEQAHMFVYTCHNDLIISAATLHPSRNLTLKATILSTMFLTLTNFMCVCSVQCAPCMLGMGRWSHGHDSSPITALKYYWNPVCACRGNPYVHADTLQVLSPALGRWGRSDDVPSGISNDAANVKIAGCTYAPKDR